MITEEQALYYSNYLQTCINNENLEEAVSAANVLADYLVTLQINVVEVKPVQVNIPQVNIPPSALNPYFPGQNPYPGAQNPYPAAQNPYPAAQNLYNPVNSGGAMLNRPPQVINATINPTIGVRPTIAAPPVKAALRDPRTIIGQNPAIPINHTLPQGFNAPIPFLHQGINQPILPHLNPNFYPAPKNFP